MNECHKAQHDSLLVSLGLIEYKEAMQLQLFKQLKAEYSSLVVSG